jgi:hypothetical protein
MEAVQVATFRLGSDLTVKDFIVANGDMAI